MICESCKINERAKRVGAYKLGHEGHIMQPIMVDGVPTIYWHFVNFTEDMEKYRVILHAERAFAEWEKVFGGIKFKASSTPVKGHHIIRFGGYDFGEDTIAVNYYPGWGHDGEMYINDKFDFGESNDGIHQYLARIIVHELGHSYGLAHSDDAESFLYWANRIGKNNIAVDADAAQGILDTYGHLMPDLIDPPADKLSDVKFILRFIYDRDDQKCTIKHIKKNYRESLKRMNILLDQDDGGNNAARAKRIYQSIKL